MRDVDKIALAAFLHDIGKFGQRSEKVNIDDIDWQFFCPRDKNGKPTHKHAAYTAKVLGDLIIEKQKDEKRILKASNGFENNTIKFIDVSAKHHIPENRYEWIVAASDRLASGFERETFEEYNKIVEDEVKTRYNKQKLDHLFIKERKFPLSKLLTNNIFAVNKEYDNDGYDKLWKEFEEDINLINKKISNFPEHIKVQSLKYLIKKYTSFIPSATSFKYKDNKIIKPNISLYDHLNASSIFASAIFSMDDEQRNKVLGYYQKGKDTLDEKVFVLIAGDFFGIQDFIFNEVKTKFAAKILRAKSAYIQILTKVLAYYICDELDISYSCIISTHAGKFEILAPNLEDIDKKIEEIQNKFNEYFLGKYFGQTGVGITYVKASIGDFILKDNYKKLRKKLGDKVDEIKYKRFNLSNNGYYRFDIDNDLDNQNLCDFCLKRKGKELDEYRICDDCNKFVKIGKALVENKFLAISKHKKENDIEVFDGFYLHFFDNVSRKLAEDDISIFDISNDEEFRGFEKWELSSYVATNKILDDNLKKYLKLEDKVEKNILTLEDLAKLSVINGIVDNKRSLGVEAIMVLKGDADGMGNFIKNSGITNSFAKYNFFARMIDYYFSAYVPIKLMENKPLYTIFAGGDDLFVLGAWDEVIEFAKKVRNDFIKFTGKNLTFSIGLVMNKANKPINYLAIEAEHLLEKSKDFCLWNKKEIIQKDKNCETKKVKYVKNKEEFCEKENVSKKDAITFYETSNWDSYLEVREKVLPYFEKLDNENLTTTFLYRLLDLIELSKKVNYECDITSTLWKSKLTYIYVRNISNQDFEFLDILNNLIENYPKELKMVLIEFIYKRRKNG
ncbi:type III-A CRISPR-associated protein Cas10/Csm1 [Caminibacter mediatlanticus TB-2]|uniref:CRISPR system single-strand-specific deoxyribonuclease Cas10/Csm1 (subtype III-A) n=1 Tax=Caminibacter mediatlanticus TB-2 TaxID=391592 RepID=A0ABX5VDP9_9BACT|nr:type III-A CRISPR-associated protein Cas10/Csm1 [Caminibacter mediatlanticus]QCT95334.1 type III-A CRISPR-associated protein Cas10/Csm1 [Caminibacter mediatlanticus TB-2]